ncbi:hypothetical protein FGO68_gene12603 [Halteria grandinella]|uniref:Uncharacterized protein n=1 Tax=Halteria grandinella TaxID=5974 RepID=A0A8J8NLB2_HALGN|nr:hypothetical protein FGO68_gene12603 [Halteria grandinella]
MRLGGSSNEGDNSYRLMNDDGNQGFDDRLGFIRKVYGIMCTQLTITAFMTLLPYLSEGFRLWIISHPGLALACAVLGLALSCGLFCIESLARKVPANYILMLFFTLCEAYTVTFVCAMVNDGLIVLQAAFMTAALSGGLTVYAVTTKRDFTMCGGLIWGIATVMIVFSLFSIFFGRTMSLIYCTLGVIVFAIYLVFDTQLIVGGEGRYAHLNEEDYILGAIILYLDIINIFLYIIEILIRLKND